MGDVPPYAITNCAPCDAQAVFGFVVGVVLAIVILLALHHFFKD